MSLLWVLFISWIVFAQDNKQTAISIPASVSQNCLLNQSGGIDFCPNYRNQIASLNLKLSQQRKKSEESWVITLLDTINASLNKFSNQSNTLIKNTLTWYPLFISEYEQYITTLFHRYLKNHSDEYNIVDHFFETTYFDYDQSGLWIFEMKIYNWVPHQFDDSLLLQVSVRNYTPNPLSNVEDLYCFSTINDQDYIYPIGIKTPFKENTITNLIIELKPGISPLLEQTGEKKIACTLVYSQLWQTKYTNRWKLSFTLK
jgi:disulfide oxidoreductase YuzD